MSQEKIYIKNVKVFSNEGLKNFDLAVANGRIEMLPPSNAEDSITGKKDWEIIDGSSFIALPSFVDLHVHLREPGFGYKETIKTGTQAAAAGGFTTVCPMPNLKPSPDSLDHLKEEIRIIESDAEVEVVPFATITRKRIGNELVDYAALAPYVAGFSDDGSGVQSEEVMKKAMKEIAKTGKILAAHCEVDSLLDGGYIHKGEYARSHGHRGISSESEWKEVERDIRLSEETGCRLHICHVSTKESVDLIREAKKRGLPVTCETGPHYLTFHDLDLKEEGRFKMNPPIRSFADREALRQGLIDGTIDVVATDHAPHSAEEKNKGLEKSAMGVVGLETAFASVYTTMVASGLMSLNRLVDAMSLAPRKILEDKNSDIIRETFEDGNMVIVDTNQKFIVDPASFKSMGKATPYEGMELQGKIKMTIYKGKPVFKDI